MRIEIRTYQFGGETYFVVVVAGMRVRTCGDEQGALAAGQQEESHMVLRACLLADYLERIQWLAEAEQKNRDYWKLAKHKRWVAARRDDYSFPLGYGAWNVLPEGLSPEDILREEVSSLDDSMTVIVYPDLRLHETVCFNDEELRDEFSKVMPMHDIGEKRGRQFK